MAIFFDYVLDELRLKDVPDGSGGFYASFYDTTTQTITSTASENPITLNSVSGSNGISRASLTERIVFDFSGVYSITFSVQLENSTANDELATIWLKKNGVNLADSASVTSVPKKHGSDNGQIITTVNYVLDLQATDYLETYWRGANTNLRLVTLSSASTPDRPLAPSVIWTAVQGGIIQGGSTTNSLASLTDISFTSLASGQIIMSNASGNFSNVTFPAIPSIPSLGSLAVMNQLSFTSLTNQPSLSSLAFQSTVDYLTQITNLPSLGSLAVMNQLSFTSLTNQPSLSSLAFQSTIDYTSAQLTNKPSLGSLAEMNALSFTSLLNQPSLGSIAFQNTVDYSQLTNTPSLGSLAIMNQLSFTSLTNQPSLSSLAFQSTIDYTSAQLTNKPSLGSLAQISNVVSPLVLSGATLSLSQASIVHNNLGGLTTGDPHTQYALLAGRSGGQTLHGGTVANNLLILRGTSANGNTATNNAVRFGVGNSGGTFVLDVKHNGTILQTANSTAVGFPDVIGADFNLTDSGGGGKTIFSHRAKLTYTGATSITGMQSTSNQMVVNGGGTVNAAEILTSNLTVENNSTVVDAKLIRLFAPTVNTGGSIGTLIGLNIPALTQGTTNWSIYSEGGAMYHSGNINIGDGYLKANSNNAYISPQTVATGDILSGDTTGVFQFDASNGNQYLQRSSADAVPPIMFFYKSRGATNALGAITAGDTVGRFSFHAYTGALVFDEVARMTAETITGADAGVLRFSTAPDRTTGVVERMTILPSGNVGIGQGNPAQLLDVNGAAQAIDFYATDTDDAANPAFTWKTDTNTGMYNAAADVLGFSTAGVEGMRIGATQGVGIGTATTNGAKLYTDQSSLTAAIPTLLLDQADLSEEFIQFQATIGVGNPISTATALPAAPSHRIRVSVNGTLRFIYAYAT